MTQSPPLIGWLVSRTRDVHCYGDVFAIRMRPFDTLQCDSQLIACAATRSLKWTDDVGRKKSELLQSARISLTLRLRQAILIEGNRMRVGQPPAE